MRNCSLKAVSKNPKNFLVLENTHFSICQVKSWLLKISPLCHIFRLISYLKNLVYVRMFKDTFPTGSRMLDNMKVNGENGEPKIKEILLFIKK